MLLPIQHIIKQITKNLNDSIRRNRSARTVESDLLARKLPPNGIQELMSHVEAKMLWAQSLIEADFLSSDSTYRLFAKLMHTSIYTESNNGIYSDKIFHIQPYDIIYYIIYYIISYILANILHYIMYNVLYYILYNIYYILYIIIYNIYYILHNIIYNIIYNTISLVLLFSRSFERDRKPC